MLTVVVTREHFVPDFGMPILTGYHDDAPQLSDLWMRQLVFNCAAR